MASTVPTDARLYWPHSHASIPANWSRDTAFDNRYMKGDTDSYTGPVNGGSTTHTHTVNTHTHVLVDHQHSIEGAASGDGGSANRFTSAAVPRTSPTHNHTSVTSSFHDSATSSAAGTAVISAAPNLPVSIFAIAIQPDDGVQDIPDTAYCYTDETTLPTGFSRQASALNTAQYRAPNTGNDGSASIIAGSGFNHIHASGGTHTHTFSSTHGHAATRVGGETSPPTTQSGGLQQTRLDTHHEVTLTSSAPGTVSSENAPTSSATVTPPSIGMLGITNTSGGATTPLGVVIPYIGTPASVPSGWAYCDGSGVTPDLRSNFVFSSHLDGNIGNTTGASTHSHSASTTHDHTTVAHTHGTSVTTDRAVAVTPFGGTALLTITAHTHAWTIGAVAPDLGADGYTTSNDDHTPLHRTVIFIKRVAIDEQPAVFWGCNF